MIFCPIDRNRLDDPAQHMPGHRWSAARRRWRASRCWKAPGFSGAFEYHDAQMYAPERIALECLMDADAHGAAIANHLAADKLLLRDGNGRRLQRARCDDRCGVRHPRQD